jgi:hypothetical protein
MFSVDTTPRYDTIDREYWQSDHTNWWYHKTRDRGTQGITPSWLLKNVDPEISGIVKLLLEYKIPTTPSSSGTMMTKKRISTVWESLLKDSWAIQHKGLILTNCETGQQYEFKDSSWKLPFSIDDLYWKCQELPVGYVGFVAPSSDKNSFLSMNEYMPRFTRVESIREVSPGVEFIQIINENGLKAPSWKKVEAIIRRYLYNKKGNDRIIVHAPY